MSAQGYWNTYPNNSSQSYSQPQHGQGQDGHSNAYGHNQSYPTHQTSGHSQGNEPLNWGYGAGDHQQQPQAGTQSYGQYDSYGSAQHSQPQYQSSQYDHSQANQHDQSYNQPYQNYPQHQDQYQTSSTYHDPNYPTPQPAHHTSSTTDYNRQVSPNPHATSPYPDHGYPSQSNLDPTHQQYPIDPNQPAGERGLLGAIGGAVAGGYAGHKVNHGFIGAVGGAYAGHKLEDHLKDKKKKDKKDKKDKYGHGGRRNSSSSSSSSDDDKKKKKKYGAAVVGGAGGAAAYAHHQKQQQQHQQSGGQQALAGNFSASSQQISLDRDYDLIASCMAVNGERHLSSISLNNCVTNSWGQLAWARGGGFGASCRNVRLVDSGRVLEAEVGNGKGGWNVSRLRLDERITNNNGDLQFLG